MMQIESFARWFCNLSNSLLCLFAIIISRNNIYSSFYFSFYKHTYVHTYVHATCFKTSTWNLFQSVTTLHLDTKNVCLCWINIKISSLHLLFLWFFLLPMHKMECYVHKEMFAGKKKETRSVFWHPFFLILKSKNKSFIALKDRRATKKLKKSENIRFHVPQKKFFFLLRMKVLL